MSVEEVVEEEESLNCGGWGISFVWIFLEEWRAHVEFT